MTDSYLNELQIHAGPFWEYFHKFESVDIKPWISNTSLSPSGTLSKLGLTSSTHKIWKMKPIVIVMMVTVCIRL